MGGDFERFVVIPRAVEQLCRKFVYCRGSLRDKTDESDMGLNFLIIPLEDINQTCYGFDL
jgi:hypothetical protein